MNNNKGEGPQSEHAEASSPEPSKPNKSSKPGDPGKSSKDAATSTSYPLIQHVQLPGKNGLNGNNTASHSDSTGHLDTKADNNSTAKDEKAAPRPDPTRYGDWEKNGRCIDF